MPVDRMTAAAAADRRTYVCEIRVTCPQRLGGASDSALRTLKVVRIIPAVA